MLNFEVPCILVASQDFENIKILAGDQNKETPRSKCYLFGDVIVMDGRATWMPFYKKGFKLEQLMNAPDYEVLASYEGKPRRVWANGQPWQYYEELFDRALGITSRWWEPIDCLVRREMGFLRVWERTCPIIGSNGPCAWSEAPSMDWASLNASREAQKQDFLLLKNAETLLTVEVSKYLEDAPKIFNISWEASTRMGLWQEFLNGIWKAIDDGFDEDEEGGEVYPLVRVKTNPQLPQMFVSALAHATVGKGDVLPDGSWEELWYCAPSEHDFERFLNELRLARSFEPGEGIYSIMGTPKWRPVEEPVVS